MFRPVEAGRGAFESVGLTYGAAGITTSEKLACPGSFSITLPCGARYADSLERGQLVRIDRRFWGIVDQLVYRWDDAGAEVEASGRQLKGLTMDRITLPPQAPALTGAQGYDAYNGTTEAVMKHYVAVNMVQAPHTARNYPGLLIAPDLGRGMRDDRYLSRHDRLDSVLQALAEAAGLGYDIVPDLAHGTYVFDVMEGVDRSGVQSERPRVVFDIARRTARGQAYTASQGEERNVFYATRSGAEFADEALTMMYVREGESEQGGLRRRERHLSLAADTPTAGEEYAELRRLALIEAGDYRMTESFTCAVLDGRMAYGRDYFLGDTVTVQSRAWGVTAHPMLTAMDTEYGGDGISRTATFGKAPLNVFGRLKRGG